MAAVQPHGAVLDACVLFPASLRDTLLRAADAGLYLPAWSADILEELQRNLQVDAGISERQAERLLATMRAHFPWAEVTGYHSLIGQMTNDPDDRHVLSAAVVAGANLIVTHNLRHFPRDALRPHRIEALSPDQFLLGLHERQPSRIRQILLEQAGDLREPPVSQTKLFDRLAVHAPEFIGRLRTDNP